MVISGSQPPIVGPAPADAAPALVGLGTRRIFLANLIAQVGIVLTGGLVRVTASGLGCPSWPDCVPGSLVPVAGQPEEYRKYIEFGNRTLTFVLGALAIAAVVAAWRMRADWMQRGLPPRRPILVLAAVPLAGTLAQAILGGLTVLTGLHPLLVGAHLLASMAIIAGCVLLCHRSAEPGDLPVRRLVRPEVRWLAAGLIAVCAAVVVMGTLVAGAGPHSGDDSAARLDLDVRSLAWLHADLVLLLVGLIVGMWLVLRLTDGPAAARAWVGVLIGLVVAQATVGYTQWFTGVPWALVIVHLLLACLIWIATLKTYLSLRTRGT